MKCGDKLAERVSLESLSVVEDVFKKYFNAHTTPLSTFGTRHLRFGVLGQAWHPRLAQNPPKILKAHFARVLRAYLGKHGVAIYFIGR